MKILMQGFMNFMVLLLLSCSHFAQSKRAPVPAPTRKAMMLPHRKQLHVRHAPTTHPIRDYFAKKRKAQMTKRRIKKFKVDVKLPNKNFTRLMKIKTYRNKKAAKLKALNASNSKPPVQRKLKAESPKLIPSEETPSSKKNQKLTAIDQVFDDLKLLDKNLKRIKTLKASNIKSSTQKELVNVLNKYKEIFQQSENSKKPSGAAAQTPPARRLANQLTQSIEPSVTKQASNPKQLSSKTQSSIKTHHNSHIPKLKSSSKPQPSGLRQKAPQKRLGDKTRKLAKAKVASSHKNLVSSKSSLPSRKQKDENAISTATTKALKPIAQKKTASVRKALVNNENKLKALAPPADDRKLPQRVHRIEKTTTTLITVKVVKPPKGLAFLNPKNDRPNFYRYSMKAFNLRVHMKNLRIILQKLTSCYERVHEIQVQNNDATLFTVECRDDFLLLIRSVYELKNWSKRIIYTYILSNSNVLTLAAVDPELRVTRPVGVSKLSVPFSQFYSQLQTHYSEFHLRAYIRRYERRCDSVVHFYSQVFSKSLSFIQEMAQTLEYKQAMSILIEFNHEVQIFKQVNLLIEEHKHELSMHSISAQAVPAIPSPIVPQSVASSASPIATQQPLTWEDFLQNISKYKAASDLQPETSLPSNLNRKSIRRDHPLKQEDGDSSSHRNQGAEERPMDLPKVAKPGDSGQKLESQSGDSSSSDEPSKREEDSSFSSVPVQKKGSSKDNDSLSSSEGSQKPNSRDQISYPGAKNIPNDCDDRPSPVSLESNRDAFAEAGQQEPDDISPLSIPSASAQAEIQNTQQALNKLNNINADLKDFATEPEEVSPFLTPQEKRAEDTEIQNLKVLIESLKNQIDTIQAQLPAQKSPDLDDSIREAEQKVQQALNDQKALEPGLDASANGQANQEGGLAATANSNGNNEAANIFALIHAPAETDDADKVKIYQRSPDGALEKVDPIVIRASDLSEGLAAGNSIPGLVSQNALKEKEEPISSTKNASDQPAQTNDSNSVPSHSASPDIQNFISEVVDLVQNDPSPKIIPIMLDATPNSNKGSSVSANPVIKLPPALATSHQQAGPNYINNRGYDDNDEDEEGEVGPLNPTTRPLSAPPSIFFSPQFQRRPLTSNGHSSTGPIYHSQPMRIPASNPELGPEPISLPKTEPYSAVRYPAIEPVVIHSKPMTMPENAGKLYMDEDDDEPEYDIPSVKTLKHDSPAADDNKIKIPNRPITNKDIEDLINNMGSFTKPGSQQRDQGLGYNPYNNYLQPQISPNKNSPNDSKVKPLPTPAAQANNNIKATLDLKVPFKGSVQKTFKSPNDTINLTVNHIQDGDASKTKFVFDEAQKRKLPVVPRTEAHEMSSSQNKKIQAALSLGLRQPQASNSLAGFKDQAAPAQKSQRVSKIEAKKGEEAKLRRKLWIASNTRASAARKYKRSSFSKEKSLNKMRSMKNFKKLQTRRAARKAAVRNFRKESRKASVAAQQRKRRMRA